jgi:Protein of unknown function (DUF2786)
MLLRSANDRIIRKEQKVENLEKIKDRIAKLLRMAADASSPEEAGIAAGRARSLMDKFQIDAFDISQKITEEFGAMEATGYFTDIPIYMSTLAVAVARYNDCQARYEHGRHSFQNDRQGKSVMFQGYKSDVEMAVEMYKRLLSAINRLCKEYLLANGNEAYDARLGSQFKAGASATVIRKLVAMTAERDLITKSKSGTSLVVAKKHAVEEHYGEAKYSGMKQRSLSAAEARAYTEGHIRGNRVEITKQVSN